MNLRVLSPLCSVAVKLYAAPAPADVMYENCSPSTKEPDCRRTSIVPFTNALAPVEVANATSIIFALEPVLTPFTVRPDTNVANLYCSGK